MLSFYTLLALIVSGTAHLLKIGAVYVPGLGYLPPANVWLRFAFWYALYGLGYLLLWAVVRRALPMLLGQDTDDRREITLRIDQALGQPRLWGANWLMVGLVGIFLGYALVTKEAGEAVIFASSLVLMTYLVNLREGHASLWKPPAPVHALRAQPGPREVTLHWEHPGDPAYAGVIVCKALASFPPKPEEGLLVYQGALRECKDSELEPGVTWHYAVFSRDDRGRCGKPVTVSAAAIPLPAEVRNPVAIPGNREIELRWQIPEEPSFHRVIVQRRPDRFPASKEDGERVYEGTLLSYIDQNLQPASVYYYRLFAVDIHGQVSRGVNVEAATKAPSVSDLRIWLERGCVRLSWVNPPGPAPERILILRKVGAAPESRHDQDVRQFDVGWATNWTDDAVTYATTYYYAVYTRYPGALYGEMQLAHITTPPPPALIQDFQAIPGRTRVELRWRFPDDPNFSGVHIRRTRGQAAQAPAGDERDVVYEGRGHEQWVDGNLEPATEYFYTAFSYDEAGHYNPDRRFIQVRTLPGPQPVNFNPPQIDATTRQVILSWIRVDATAPFVHLRRWEGQPPASLNYREPGGNLLCQGEEVRYVDRDLLAGHTYYYVAYAVDQEGCASEGVMHEVRTPPSWNISVVLVDRVVNVSQRISLPESITLQRVLPEVLRRLGRGMADNLRLHNQTRNYDYRLDGSLLDQGTQPGDELILEYEPHPEEA